MIEKTTGIVLRIAPFSRTSHVVVWFTTGFGKITTLVKGSQRVKSAFLGQYDLFYSCELLFYSRDRNGVHIIRECSPVDTRTPLRHNWRAAVCASYVCDLVSRMAPTSAANPQFFQLLDTGLTFLCTGATLRSFVPWFELRAMEAAGFSPRLSSCVKCGKALRQPREDTRFSSAAGGAVCRACAVDSVERSILLTPDVLSTLRHWQKTGSPGHALRTGCSPKQLLEIEKLLGTFLDYHVHVLPTGRSVALELLPQR